MMRSSIDKNENAYHQDANDKDVDDLGNNRNENNIVFTRTALLVRCKYLGVGLLLKQQRKHYNVPCDQSTIAPPAALCSPLIVTWLRPLSDWAMRIKTFDNSRRSLFLKLLQATN
ncbi:hypothetical protein PoB_004793800 [Plakobranchus ocellatus]|uniref:Uncharacterized protein n=1 Tax=Plakobranchus ocellatus TaxID=259542 RepID=A0AAV4BRI3_9GAST|nr:hypothetical protein PoB_004793800 [Plakobranchus ocellatus]